MLWHALAFLELLGTTHYITYIIYSGRIRIPGSLPINHHRNWEIAPTLRSGPFQIEAPQGSVDLNPIGKRHGSFRLKKNVATSIGTWLKIQLPNGFGSNFWWILCCWHQKNW
jgi:hypothetical protein